MAIKIGYYDIQKGTGYAGQKPMIAAAGGEALKIADPANLRASQVLFLEHGPNAYKAEFTAAISHITDWVSTDGGIVLFYDRSLSQSFFGGFTPDATAPGGMQFNFVNERGPGAIGPAGTVIDANLSNYSFTNQGYASLAQFQDGDFAWLQTRDDPTKAVTVMQSLGAGYIVYSSLSLDVYASHSGDSFWSDYGANMLSFTEDLVGRNRVLLTNSADNAAGTAGMDDVFGLAGADKYKGGSGNDLLHGDAGKDNLSGDNGDDFVWGGVGNDVLAGGKGNDQLWGQTGDDKLGGGDGADFLNGGSGNDIINGNAGQDTLYGGDGNDTLVGGLIADHDDSDMIIGGAGIDIMTGGGGAQIYFFAEGDAPLGPNNTRDTITDFLHGTDKIDLTAFDRDFVFTDTGFFSGVENEILLGDLSNGKMQVLIDLDGNGIADEVFTLVLYDNVAADQSDFVF